VAEDIVAQVSPPGTQEPVSIVAAREARAAGPSLRMGKRLVTIDLGDVEGYENMSYVAWVNYPPEIRDKFQKDDEASRLEALREIIVSTNFVNEDGTPFYAPSTPEFWKSIPDDLAVIIIQRTVNQVGKLTPTNAAR
jgi:hypothetical protein